MKVLAIDVGRGTQDILLYDSTREIENSIQMVLPSRTVILAGRIREATRSGRRVIMRGVTMGGGPVTKAARQHIGEGGVIMATPSAAATFSDDMDEVRSMGVRIIDESEAGKEAGRKNTVCLETADVLPGSICRSLEVWGVPADYHAAAVSVQDHGAAPPGESDRRYRFSYFQETLRNRPRLPSLCFDRGNIPDRFTRMKGVAESLSTVEHFVLMDAGFAALLGACFDYQAATAGMKVLVNSGNGHTLAALVEGLTIRSFFEHHTRRLEEKSFTSYVDQLVRGSIDDRQVFEDGGHGAYNDGGEYPGAEGVDIWSITGPKRQNFAKLPPGYRQAAPFGSMMQTGCYGLLASFYLCHPSLDPDGRERLLYSLTGD